MTENKVAQPAPVSEVAPMPVPRLQFRWTEGEHPASWVCFYELVLPLGEYDIRREIWKDGEEVGKQESLPVQIGSTTMRTTAASPFTNDRGDLIYYPPYRDGAHASWDAPHLGNLPIFMIAPDGRYIEKPRKPEDKEPTVSLPMTVTEARALVLVASGGAYALSADSRYVGAASIGLDVTERLVAMLPPAGSVLS